MVVIDPGRCYDGDLEYIFYGPLYVAGLEALLGIEKIHQAIEHEGQIFYSLPEKPDQWYVVREKK